MLVESGAHKSASRCRLAGVLACKAACELVFVVVLGGWFMSSIIGSHPKAELEYRGNNNEIIGSFAFNTASDAKLDVQLFVDETFVASTKAVCDNDVCRINFRLPQLVDGEHEAQAFVSMDAGADARRVLRSVAAPLRFKAEHVQR